MPAVGLCFCDRTSRTRTLSVAFGWSGGLRRYLCSPGAREKSPVILDFGVFNGYTCTAVEASRAYGDCWLIYSLGSFLRNANKSRILTNCHDSQHFEILKCHIFKAFFFGQDTWHQLLWKMSKRFKVRIPDKYHVSLKSHVLLS